MRGVTGSVSGAPARSTCHCSSALGLCRRAPAARMRLDAAPGRRRSALSSMRSTRSPSRTPARAAGAVRRRSMPSARTARQADARRRLRRRERSILPRRRRSVMRAWPPRRDADAAGSAASGPSSATSTPSKKSSNERTGAEVVAARRPSALAEATMRSPARSAGVGHHAAGRRLAQARARPPMPYHCTAAYSTTASSRLAAGPARITGARCHSGRRLKRAVRSAGARVGLRALEHHHVAAQRDHAERELGPVGRTRGRHSTVPKPEREA